MPTIEEVSSRLPPRTPSFSVGSVSRSIVARVPWYIWLFALCAAWLRFGNSAGSAKKKVARSSRKRLPVSNAAQNTPRRAPPPPVDPSTRTLPRRGSFAGRPEMRERRGSSSSFANSYRERPQMSLSPAASSRNLYPVPLPRASTSLRHSTLPSASTLAGQPQSSRKRTHEVDSPVGGGPKRSKLDSFDSDSDDDRINGMDLDLSSEDGDVPRVASHQVTEQADETTKVTHRDQEQERRSESTATSTLDFDMHADFPGAVGAREQPMNRRKRSSRDSPALSDEGEERRGPVKRRISKKAKKQAIGTGSVRDKRGIEQVASDDDEGRSLEAEDGGGERERNADSDVESQDGTSRAVDHEASTTAPKGKGVAKRFREKLKRSGSDDEDLMGDDDLLSPPPPGPPAADRFSTSTPKKRLSSRSARKLKQPAMTALSRTPKRSASTRPSTIDDASSKERKVGEVWQNHEGDYYRLDEPDATKGEQEVVQRRLVECREKRRKYRLPKDVRHPDTKEMHEVVVEKWVTQEEYRALFEQRKLAWQASYEEEEKEKERTRQLEQSNALELGDHSMEDGTLPTRRPKELGLFYSRGTNSPLRMHAALSAPRFMSTSSSTSSLSSLVPSSPKLTSSASSGSLSSLASSSRGGRLRLPSTVGIQSPARRAWSIAERSRAAVVDKEREAEAEKEREGGQQQVGDGKALATKTTEVARVDSSEPTPKATSTSTTAGEFSSTILAKDKGSASGFSFSAAPSVVSSNTTKTGAPVSAPAPAAPLASAVKAESNGLLSFGSGPAQAAPVAPKDAAPSFSFGPTASKVTPLDAPRAVAPSSTSVEKTTAPVSTPTSAPPFSFSANGPSTSFSIGAAPPTQPSEPPKISGGFSFGSSTSSKAPTPAPQAAPLASTPAISFGAAAATPGGPLAAPSTGSFSFGAASSSGAPSGSTTPAFSVSGGGGFSFGQTATGPSTPTGTGAPLFSFGTGGDDATSNGATTPRRRAIRKMPGR